MLNLIYKPIKEDLKKVDEIIWEQLVSGPNDALPGRISKYLLSYKGKFLRPALVLLSSRLGSAYLKNKSKLIKLAAAIELIHTATLIHDDIIDSATIRRNHLTLNSKYGDNISMIMGDYLYAKAFCLLSSIGSAYILEVLAHIACKMCAGELNECQGRNAEELKDCDYIFLVEQKTASLISGCCQLGCYISGGSKRDSKILADYGLNLGIAFQLADDCLDFIGDKKMMGKLPGSDIKNGKLTLPAIYLLNHISYIKRKKIMKAIRDISNPRDIIRLAKEYGFVDKAYTIAEEYACRAKKELSKLDGFVLKENLSLLADYVVKRRG